MTFELFEQIVLYSGLGTLATAFVMVFIDLGANFGSKSQEKLWYYYYQGIGGIFLTYFLIALVVYVIIQAIKLF